MITIIGTGHVFDIAEPTAFIIRNLWPGAVLVEADEPPRAGSPRIYAKAMEGQAERARRNGVRAGGELASAAEAGRAVGAEVIRMDTGAARAMEEMWAEMPLGEKARYAASGFMDRALRRGRPVKFGAKAPERDGAEIRRRRYPTMVRKLIDERDERMASEIEKALARHEDVVAVVGDGHVDGICRILGRGDVRTVRLRELLDSEAMGRVRSAIWEGSF
ncbi:MAG: TraB/GumN family protein [Candidatus Methanoplasma sp.]|nr:TraB/GumN family protein [Candidatus Methanoplasma sp.]